MPTITYTFTKVIHPKCITNDIQASYPNPDIQFRGNLTEADSQKTIIVTHNNITEQAVEDIITAHVAANCSHNDDRHRPGLQLNDVEWAIYELMKQRFATLLVPITDAQVIAKAKTRRN